jgi:hypothetical protein
MTRPVSEMIAYLVGSKFPDQRWLRDPARPRITRSGEDATQIAEEQRLAALAELEAYEAELRGKSAEEVRALYEAERRRQRGERRRKRQARAQAEERGRFFNRPGAEADFLQWSKAAYWTLDEGVALLLGRAPELVSWASVSDYAQLSPFVRQYAQVRDLAVRARERAQLALRNEPRAFLDWAKRSGITYPSQLEQHVRSAACGGKGEDAQASPQEMVTTEKPLLTRERDTVLKLLIGMAVQRYGFDARAKRGTAVSEIVNDLDSLGISLDPKTVRKWLNEAADLLPGELEEGDRGISESRGNSLKQ